MHQRQTWMIASRLEKRSLLIAVNILAALSIFFFGYDQGMMGGVNESDDYVHTMGFGHVDANGKVVVTNTLLQGGIGGAVADRYGRIKTIGFRAAWGVVGASLQTSAQNTDWMLCARVVNGIGTGILNAVVPAWASEIADYTNRGQFIAIEFTLNIFGVVVAYWLEFGVSFINGGKSAIRWRFPIAFQIIPLLILLAICWMFPESPRWLCKADRDDEALYILQRLRGTEGADAGKAELELNDIRRVVELERQMAHGTSYFHMLFGIGSGKLHTGRRVQLCIWLQIIQSWTGIAGITMFGPTICGIAGFTSTK
ncbi:general substrate transporter, partial [Aureobasidium melanogenum]